MYIHKTLRTLIIGIFLFGWCNLSVAQSVKPKKEKTSKAVKKAKKEADKLAKIRAKELAKSQKAEEAKLKTLVKSNKKASNNLKTAKKELAKAKKSERAKEKAMAKNKQSGASKVNKGKEQIAKTSTFKKKIIDDKALASDKGSSPQINNSTADRYALDIYKDLGYKESADKFLDKKKNLTLEDQTRIANSFRLNHDIDKAAVWYAKVADKSKDPINKLRYAQVLQSNGNAKLAGTYYKKYADALKKDNKWDNLAAMFADNVDKKDRFLKHDINLINENNINSNKLEYSPTFYEEGVIFVSTKKPDAYPSIGEDPWIKDNFMSLYYAPEGEAGLLSDANTFSYDITTKFHEGPVTFSRGFDQIFFTRNDYNNKKRTNSKDGIMKLQIYTSYRDGETWSTPEALPFNTPEHEEAHPALSPDGAKLYFASDRPGGFGGMDIYVSELTDGEWAEPTNMGGDVNTPGNELFPFIHENGMLFFASNGHDGMGGLDVFTASEDEGEWSQVNNVGTPFNSIKDDFGFVINADGDKGYLTSARKGGNGKDDIYSFDLPTNIFNATSITLCTYDEVSGERISGAEVVQSNKNVQRTSLDELLVKIVPTENSDEFKLRLKSDFPDGSDLAFKTDANGEYAMNTSFDMQHSFIAQAKGYEMGSINFITSREKSEYCIPLKKKVECLEFNGNVLNATTNKSIPFATLKLIGSNKEAIEITADESGKFDFGCIPCNDQYSVEASKNNKSAIARISTLNIECSPSNNITKDIYLEDPVSVTTPSNPGVSAGQVIVLENIFYDFDKFYIRSDAEPDLNKVVSLMNQYPSMVIELGSHTDARGRFAYNETLSANRAKSAVDYIVSRGIDSRRIIAKGYGETTPRNRCKDGVTCNEDEHQFNRRTEIKVLSIGRNDVDIRYNDNRPDYTDPAPLNKRIDKKIERN